VPQGLAAVGWRIGVYWREDHKFYLGDLATYNDEEDLYEMNYDDSKLPTAACAVSTHVCSVDLPGLSYQAFLRSDLHCKMGVSFI
jgi:hypothetical protein